MRIYRLVGNKAEEIESVEKKIVNRLFSGVGLFETMKILYGYPLFVEDHIQRMSSSAEKIWGRRIDEESVFRISVELSRSGGELGVIRVILVEDSLEFFLFFVIDKYPYSRTSDLRVRVTEYERNRKGFSTGLKPISYFENVVLRERANRDGFDEALLLSAGFIAEGTRSNVFWVKDGVVCTPPLDLGILAGITRRKVLELCARLGIETREQCVNVDEIFDADGIFITSSLFGVAPVGEICYDERTRRLSENPICSFLKSEFSNLELQYVREKLKAL